MDTKPTDFRPKTERRMSRNYIILAVVVFVSMILLATGSYAATKYVMNRSKVSTANDNSIKSTNSSSQAAMDSKNITPQATQDQSTSASKTTSATPSSASKTVYCGVSGMPEGVCTAINSVEKNGLKNNEYVAADTSKAPTSGTLTVDKSSWKAVSEQENTLKFSAVYAGKTYAGTAVLKPIGGIWKVVSYTLE